MMLYPITVSQAQEDFIVDMALSKSPNTAATYKYALVAFNKTLVAHDIQPETATCDVITLEVLRWFIRDLKKQKPATEKLYLSALATFLRVLLLDNHIDINMEKVRATINQFKTSKGSQIPNYPQNAIEIVIEHVIDSIQLDEKATYRYQLIMLRDKAFIITLADTGLRVHEACNLLRGNINYKLYQAVIVGKGKKQAVIRFSERSVLAIQEYLQLRSALDGNSASNLASLPVFSRHDRAVGKEVEPITTNTGRAIVDKHVRNALAGTEYFKEKKQDITPHTFRHRFVTEVLIKTGNLKLAQELARHEAISVTERYSHLTNADLDRAYYEVFEELN